MHGLKEATVRTLGTRPIAAAARWIYRDQLRILAYHGVPDPAAFEMQLDHVLLPDYQIVAGRHVVEALRTGERLPQRSVWITFDDGLQSVVENALPLLHERGLSATVFVCPGIVESDRRHWWEVISTATEQGWRLRGVDPDQTGRFLKGVPDEQRRQALGDAQAWLEAHGSTTSSLEPTVAGRNELEAWLTAGMEIGNHTWDHPCLDQCEGTEQAAQIEQADRWLDKIGAFGEYRIFAYPNGDWADAAEKELVRLGYDIALLFDHEVAVQPPASMLRMSRLRIDSTISIPRTRAIVSGGHSALFTRVWS